MISLAKQLTDHAGSLLHSREFHPQPILDEILVTLLRARSLSHDNELEVYIDAGCSLAIVYSQTSKGDQPNNQETAIELLREALAFYESRQYVHDCALVATNLSVILLDRELGNRVENITDAIALCRAALHVRSRKSAPVNWAYTSTNLAHALHSLARLETKLVRVNELIREALKLYKDAADVFLGVDDVRRGAIAKQNRATAALHLCTAHLANAKILAARRVRADGVDMRRIFDLADDDDQDLDGLTVQFAELLQINPGIFGEDHSPAWVEKLCNTQLASDHRRLLADARADVESALELNSSGGGAEAALGYEILANIVELESSDNALRAKHLTSALARLTGSGMPRHTLRIAAALGEMHAVTKSWTVAAEVFSTAVEALEHLYRERGTEEGRNLELQAYHKIAEWACYSLAKAGDVAQAVRVMERGRARALWYRLGRGEADLATLASFDSGLASRLVDARERLRKRVGGSDYGTGSIQDVDAAGLELDQVIEQVRMVPGMKHFLLGASDIEIASASHRHGPLVYLVSTPSGSIALLVEPGDGDVELQVSLISDSPISSGLLLRGLVRYRAEGPSGLLFAELDDMNESLSELQEMLGEAFGRPLRSKLQEMSASAVTLVPAGILGSMPFAAALTNGPSSAKSGTGDSPTFLGDVARITIAPSAVVFMTCEERTRRSTPSARRFVGVADPTMDLTWANAEVAAVSALDQWSNAVVVAHESAVCTRVLAEAVGADYLHLPAMVRDTLTTPRRLPCC